jgi:hypothetical protein
VTRPDPSARFSPDQGQQRTEDKRPSQPGLFPGEVPMRDGFRPRGRRVGS